MPIDPASGVCYALHGRQDGVPLMIGLPLMASHTAIFGAESDAMLRGYLDPLADRYRILLIDYPSIGGSADIPPEDLTADRVCTDILSVADAAGFDRFAWWGYSWSGNAGLQLASRTDRLSALVIGGWPPLDAPYCALLAATVRKIGKVEPSAMAVLRSTDQYCQWSHYLASVVGWPEADAVAAIACPRIVYYGADGDMIEAGLPINIASTIRRNRARLAALGWQVCEIEGRDHGGAALPDAAVPPVKAFLDGAVAR